MTQNRNGERGLSLIEAIVIVTITSVLALLMLPLAPRTGARTLATAERSAAALETANAERAFRALVRAVSPRGLDEEARASLRGDARGAWLLPNLAMQTGCAPAGAPSVHLIVQAEALVCEGGGVRRALLRWEGSGATELAYSADGVTWRAAWSGDVPPLVRLSRSGVGGFVWIERVGGVADAP